MKPTNDIYTGLPTTIFEVMSALARKHEAINLGQGFPDRDGPEIVRRTAAEALLTRSNQYPPMAGLPELRQAVARSAQRFHGIAVDWEREVLVTSGATEALNDAIAGLVVPGDEVVVFAPLYDCYLPLLRRAGAVPVVVNLAPPDWQMERDVLARAFSPRTKAILLNTPGNPSGKVFSESELRTIAELVIAHDAYAICDEVYEHIVFAPHRHCTLLSLPGMRERTVRIGSAGKTLSLTGWKVGYATAAPALLDPIVKAHQYTTFATPPNLQLAAAVGLDLDAEYYADLASGLMGSRDRLSAGLSRLGYEVLPAGGTYFVVASFARLSNEDDVTFCRRMTAEAGVTAIPLSAFYDGNAPRFCIRFCFAKQDAVLDAALERLAAWTP